MQSYLKTIPLLVGVPLFALVTAAPTVVAQEIGETPSFGVYDPDANCARENKLSLERLYVSWANYKPGELLRQLRSIQAHGQHPFVALEPWPDPAITPQPSALLADVAAGKYDRRIQELSQEIAAFAGPVLLSWGQNMENVTGRYPWASHEATLYLEAYRHFVTTSRLWAQNMAYVWSPAGDKGLEHYWPGDGYADYIGVSVFEFPTFDQAYYHLARRSFHDQMIEKYGRVAKYAKPVVIAECGVTGGREYQLSWISEALRDLGNYPLLKALIYFNAKDTDAPEDWGNGYSAPSFRISGCAFAEVIDGPQFGLRK
jgi:cellulose synthase (UDP-forming)